MSWQRVFSFVERFEKHKFNRRKAMKSSNEISYNVNI